MKYPVSYIKYLLSNIIYQRFSTKGNHTNVDIFNAPFFWQEKGNRSLHLATG